MSSEWRSWVCPGVLLYAAFPRTIEPDGPVEEAIRQAAASSFFGSVTLANVGSRKATAKLRRLLDDLGLRRSLSGGPSLLSADADPSADEKSERRRFRDLARRLIDDALEIEGDTLMLVSGPSLSETAREDAVRRLIDSLVDVATYAAAHDPERTLNITLETFDTDVSRRRLIGPTTTAARVIRAVRRFQPAVGLTLDLAHLPQIRESIEEAIRASAGLVTDVHVGNTVIRDRGSPLYGDEHPPFGHPLGEHGIGEVVEFIKALRAVGYFAAAPPGRKAVVSVEVKPQPEDDPEAIWWDSLGVLRAALEAVWADPRFSAPASYDALRTASAQEGV